MHMEVRMDESEQDRAIAARLAKLRSMPVDTGALDRKLEAVIGRSARKPAWFIARPFRAIAASAAILLIIAVALYSTSGGPALASATRMAQVHLDVVSGKTPVTQVNSIEEANRAISQQWAQSPELPGIPAMHGMACCMKSVKNKKVACVLFKSEGVPITMTVANAEDMKTPSCPEVKRNGVTFHVQSVDALSMVMTERDNRWVCLIAQLPADRLMDIAEKLEF
jgi:hypothetical protein